MADSAAAAPPPPPAPPDPPDPPGPPPPRPPGEEQYVGEGAAPAMDPPETTTPDCCDAETITDVCNSTDLPEFEIISLLEDQLPVYRLRADTAYGYDRGDWLTTPLTAPDAQPDLSAQQIHETLKYFLLCADRVGQMTKTYNDIDAVTRLLEEKERDLELAARIGQSLLRKNRTLSEQNDYLEEQVGHVAEEVAQLHHELNLKDELLQFYTRAAQESEEDWPSPTGRRGGAVAACGGFGSDTLSSKLKELEEENLSLRSEASHLKSETETYEEKEQQLVNDCVNELRLSGLQISSIAEELARKTEDASRQQEEITHLLSHIVDLQKKTKMFAVENEELSQHLIAAKDAQRQLTAELTELEEKYLECIEMLHEAQEELKDLRNRSYPAGAPRRFHPLGLYPMDSLAAEIEGTMRKELILEDPECEEQKGHRRRVFQTVKSINRSARQRSPVPGALPPNIPGSNQTLSSRSSPLSSCPATPRSGGPGDVAAQGVALDNRAQSMLLEAGTNRESVGDASAKMAAAGAEDLRLALRRLSLRRQNNLSERRFFDDERRRGGGLALDAAGPPSPPDSVMSLGSLQLWAAQRGSHLPDKLQIVKPLEGSATLHHWQQLAQPHLGVILDARPGVIPKGYRPLELDLERNRPWGGLEEQEEEEEEEPGERYFQNLPTTSAAVSPGVRCPSAAGPPDHQDPQDPQDHQDHLVGTPSPALPGPWSLSPSPHLSNMDALAAYYPGKCMAHTSSTYTFTTCRILHPTDELTRVTPSLNPGPAPSSCVMTSSLLATPIATPIAQRRLGLLPSSQSSTNLRDATRTTSTSLGLVRLLQERGISAAMYHHPPHGPRPPGSEGLLFSTSVAPPLRPPSPPHCPTPSRGGGAPEDPDDGANTPTTGFDLRSPPYDHFLASRPARAILQDVAGTGGRGPGGPRGGRRRRGGARDSESQTDVSVSVAQRLNLLDKVKRLGVAGGVAGGGALGGALRRNRSYPAVGGAGMAMKGPGPQGDAHMLLGVAAASLPKQSSLQ